MGQGCGGEPLSTVRGPSDDEVERAQWLFHEGRAKSIKDVMSDMAGYEIEDIVAYGAQLAIENAIENGLTIDIVDLVNQHLEWQNILV